MAAASSFPVAPMEQVPTILQSDTSECALASLAMIAGAWGLKADLAAFRTRVALTPRGVNLRTLMNLAASIGLAARPVRIGLRRIDDLNLPAILHWNMDHFVVLESLKGNIASIVDPARGRLSLAPDAMSPHFTGIAIEFTPTVAFQPGIVRLSRSFRRAWFDDRRLRSAALSALWLTIVLQITIVALPFAYRNMIDHPGASLAAAHLLWIGCGIVLMMMVQAGSAWTRGLVITRLGGIFVHRVSTHIVARLFSLPVSFFQRQMLGDILFRVQSVDNIRRFVTDQAAPIVIDLLVGTIVAVLMIVFSPHLALIVLTGLTIEIGVRAFGLRRQRELSEDLLTAEGKEMSRLLESMRAVQAIKLAGREAQRFAVWENELVRVLNANARLTRHRNSIGTIASATGAFEWAAVLAVGILGVGFAPVSTGVLFGFLAYRGVFRERVSTLMENISSLQLASAHVRRLDDLMLTEPEPQGGALMPVEGPGYLKLENIAFRYGPTEPLVLDDVSLEFPAGACIAFVGPSGGGKSTLVKLILGIEEPLRGTIKLDGVSMADVNRQAWRERFGTVMQDDTLLAGSISANIAFFEPRIDPDRVIAAAMAAAIHDEIETMPMEYGTLVGDMGMQISGGQRQRILIARALYREPGLILFDEGTANLDEASEKKISEVLANLSPTRIIVAHRSHLLTVADIVYEVRDGKVSRIR